ncbi:response regulator [Chelatococcus sp. GCM10030263]|uniref:response regulator n=1 Tax=Chelatococcus sp. GCM10030263 TaxID=3273387 RepID=UPI00361CE987
MADDATPAGITGRRVLLVEDEFPVLLLIEEMLLSLGCEITETASNLPDAVKRARECSVDVAVLDINLAGQKVYPAAALLRKRGIPIVFSTGYGLTGIEPEWAHYPVVQKPYAMEQLRQGLAMAIARAA